METFTEPKEQLMPMPRIEDKAPKFKIGFSVPKNWRRTKSWKPFLRIET